VVGSEARDGGDDEGGAGGLGEGTEEVGAHAGDVADVVTDVVCLGGWWGVRGGELL
jgi:hypothetical protein